jgi:hypothetical protein
MGSFDCVVVRFAYNNFAQDDKVGERDITSLESRRKIDDDDGGREFGAGGGESGEGKGGEAAGAGARVGVFVAGAARGGTCTCPK